MKKLLLAAWLILPTMLLGRSSGDSGQHAREGSQQIVLLEYLNIYLQSTLSQKHFEKGKNSMIKL
jgi:hypothetical protein